MRVSRSLKLGRKPVAPTQIGSEMRRAQRTGRTRAVLARGALTAALALSSLAGLAAAQAGDVEVLWDEIGVPHVYGTSDEAVFFGQGYACAKDRFAQMHMAQMGSRGRLTELLGINPDLYAGETDPVTIRRIKIASEMVQVDRWAIITQVSDYAQSRYNSLDPQTRSALDAYAEGVNAYVAELVASSDPLPAPLANAVTQPGDPGFPAWEPWDCIAVWEYQSRQFNRNPFVIGGKPEQNEASYECEFDIGNGCTSFPTPAPAFVDESSTVVQMSDIDQDVIDAIDAFALSLGLSGSPGIAGRAAAGPTFSHGCVIGKGAATSSGALVWSDPQTGVGHPGLFHEVHLVNNDIFTGFNIRGVSMVGCPALFLGYGDKVAWSGTSLGIDNVDLIRVKSDGNGGYLRTGCTGGPFVPDTTQTILERVAGTPPTNATLASAPVKGTCFGPVVTDLLELSCPDCTDDYVLRSTQNSFLERHALQAAIHMLKAQNVNEFRERTKYWVGPALHCAFGDTNGHIGYTPLMAAPLRGDPAPNAGLIAVSDGEDPAKDWQGSIPYDFLPWVTKNPANPNDAGPELLIVANQRPVGAWYPIPLLLTSSSSPNTRWLAFWDYFEHNQGPYNTESLAELAFDPVSRLRREIVRLGKHIYEEFGGTGLSTTSIDALLGPLGDGDSGLIGWYEDGAKSLFDDNRIADIAALQELRLATTPIQVKAVTDEYGTGRAGGIAFLRDMIERDLEDTEPLTPGPGQDLDNAIINLVNISLTQSAMNAPATISPTRDYLNFSSLYKDMAPAYSSHPDNVIDVLGQTVLCKDGTTLWSTGSKIYTHIVDMADPSSAGVMHPLGNHEDPLDLELGEHDRDDAQNSAWGDASFSQTPVVPDGMQAAIRRGTLGRPGTTGEIALDSDETSGIAGPAVAAFETPLVSYYGSPYPGWNPERSISLEIVGNPTEVERGDTLDIRVHGAQAGSSWTLYVGGAKKNVLVDGLNREYVDILCTGPGRRGGVYSCGVVLYQDPDGDGVFTNVSIPATLIGDNITMQAFANAPTDPNEPATQVSTAGMEIRVTQ